MTKAEKMFEKNVDNWVNGYLEENDCYNFPFDAIKAAFLAAHAAQQRIIDEQAGEIARLEKWNVDADQECIKLQEENKRLREALERIVNGTTNVTTWQYDIARTALMAGEER
jgi:hypothetical protein